MRHCLHLGSVVIGLLCVGDCGIARADDVFTLTPQPANSSQPGFIYGRNADGSLSTPSASQLRSGPGVLSNGDGNLSLNQQDNPGLEFDIPYAVSPTSTAPGQMIGAHSTSFYDTSLILSSATNAGDFKASGPVRLSDQTMVQDLSGGSFSIFASTDTSDPRTTGNAAALLLAGTVGSSTITGPLNGRSGAVFNAGPVTFTGGSLLPGMPSTAGSDAFSLALIGNGFGSTGGYLSAFDATVTGSITAAVPLPAQFWPGVMVLGAIILVPTGRKYLRNRAALEME